VLSRRRFAELDRQSRPVLQQDTFRGRTRMFHVGPGLNEIVLVKLLEQHFTGGSAGPIRYPPLAEHQGQPLARAVFVHMIFAIGFAPIELQHLLESWHSFSFCLDDERVKTTSRSRRA
jgi:hypothetical protein